MDNSVPGSSVHENSQARILEWVAMSCPRRSFWSKDGTPISCIGRLILCHRATREVYICVSVLVALLYSTLLWSRRLGPARLLCPWNSPGKNTGVGCHSLFQSDVLGWPKSSFGFLHNILCWSFFQGEVGRVLMFATYFEMHQNTRCLNGWMGG